MKSPWLFWDAFWAGYCLDALTRTGDWFFAVLLVTFALMFVIRWKVIA